MLSNEKWNSKLTESSNHDKTRNEKLKYDFNREAEKYQHYHLEKMINMNILRVKKYCHLIEDK